MARELVRRARGPNSKGEEDLNCTADGYPIIERVFEVPAQFAFV